MKNIQRMKHWAIAVGMLGAFATQAQNLTPIKISYQPSLYWALPLHVATKKGWWLPPFIVPKVDQTLAQDFSAIPLELNVLRYRYQNPQPQKKE